MKLTRLAPAAALATVLAALLGGCTALPTGLFDAAPPEAAPADAPRPREQLWALTDDHRLLHFAAATPQRIDRQCRIDGLRPGEQLLGIDFRVARGVLYALGRSGQLYTLDTERCSASAVGTGIGWPLLGARVGIDFNPVVDLLRVVTEAGQNLRVHPDTGALVDADPATPGAQPDVLLGYVNTDPNAGKTTRVVAAGYTYNKRNDKLTTLYGIDVGQGLLVMQGSHESKVPPVSPNTGRVMTVGPLGVAGVVEADLDISDVDNTPLAALRTDRTRLYRINVDTGRAELIGLIGDGAPLRSIAIEP